MKLVEGARGGGWPSRAARGHRARKQHGKQQLGRGSEAAAAAQEVAGGAPEPPARGRSDRKSSASAACRSASAVWQ